MTRILAIDPSGTGTSGVFFKSNSEEQFISYQNPNWKKHYEFIDGMVKVYHPDILLYETTNFISLRGKDMTSLLKLMGTMETLSLACSIDRPRIEAIPVNQVKELRNKLLKREVQITELEYKQGIGWHHNGKKISTHELDAYLVYWLWESKAENKPNKKLIGKTIEANKMKPNIRAND